MRFILFYDNLIRDYRGLLLLKAILKRTGHHAWLAPLWRDSAETIRNYNPDTVVMGQAGEETTSAIAKFVRDHRINLVLNTTENVCYEHRKEYFFKVNFREWNDPFIDLQVIISHDFNRYIHEHTHIKDKSKYKFIGCPRFDLSVNPELCVQETECLKRKYHTDCFNRKFLYISSFIFDDSGGQASEKNYDFVNVPQRFKREMAQKRQHHEILSQLLPQIKKNGDVLLIKRHPWDKSSFYQDHYGGENIILIENQDYIAPLLQISDAVLHTESTVAIEAWIQGKKSISILPDFDGDRSKLKNHMQYEPVATNFDSLCSLIEDYPWENTAKSLENYKPYTDGLATIRLAKLLDDLPPKSGKTQFDIKASERILLKRRYMEKQLLYSQRLDREPKDSYTYHFLYLEQFRRQIDNFYARPIRRYVADKAQLILNGCTGAVEEICNTSTESNFGILQQAKDLVAQGRGALAIPVVENLLEREPDSAASHAFFARVMMEAAELEKAKAHLIKAVSLCPDEIEYQNQLAQLLIVGGEEESAAAILKKVIETRPAHIDALWILGQMSLKRQGPDKARHFFEMILKIEPCHDGAHRMLSNLSSLPRKIDVGARNDENYQSIDADADLTNIRLQAERQRMGRWKVGMHGLTIFCHDLMSFYIAAKDIFHNRVYDFQSTRIEPVIIDGGGHIGLFTLFIKQKYPRAKITVFEPDRKAIELLKKNLKINRIFDITIVQAGLYKLEGTLPFGSDHSDGSSIFAKEKTGNISVVRLGEYIRAPIDFIKLNIEGAELDVLTEIYSKLTLVRELVIEYHGFNEIGQKLHKILTLLDQAGYRYMISDFDEETNPASKPPFHLDRETRFYLLIYAKKLFVSSPAAGPRLNNRAGNLTLEPVSRKFGFDRGVPVDRYYIENYLRKNRADIRGRVLEIADNTYTAKYGIGVTQSDVLHVKPATNVTIVGDLATGENIPKSKFDCIILTQTLNFVFDVKSLLQNAAEALKPGGVLLLTASGISQISRYDMDRWGDYWRFTDKSLSLMLSEAIPEGSFSVEAFGNVAAAKAFLDGRALHELDPEILTYRDPDYQLLLTARVEKPGLMLGLYPEIPARLPQKELLKTPLILLYHRVADDPIDAQLLTVSPNNFLEHLEILSNHFRTMPLYELLQEIRSGDLRPDTVALTFDDGYSDNLTNALPLLEKLNIPATIFVTSGMLGINQEFWWDSLEKIFLGNNPLPEELVLYHYKGIKIWELGSKKDRFKAYEDLCEILKGEPHERIQPQIEKLFDWAKIPNITRSSHRILSPPQLKKMAASPVIEIGSHSMSHTRLSLLSPEQQRNEIFESKQRLEAILNKPVRLFSYPFGTQTDFTKTSVQIVAEAGYEAGIANIQGNVCKPIDVYAIPRRLVRNWTGSNFNNWLSENKKEELETKNVIEKKRMLTGDIVDNTESPYDYEGIYDEYRRGHPWMEYRYNHIDLSWPLIIPLIINWTIRQKGKIRLLEVGCGAGGSFDYFFKSILHRNSVSYTGIDASNKQIENAQKDFHDTSFEFVLCDAHLLNFEDESFDIVYESAAIGYLQDPLKALREMLRVSSDIVAFRIDTYPTEQVCFIGYKGDVFFKDGRMKLSQKCIDNGVEEVYRHLLIKTDNENVFLYPYFKQRRLLTSDNKLKQLLLNINGEVLLHHKKSDEQKVIISSTNKYLSKISINDRWSDIKITSHTIILTKATVAQNELFTHKKTQRKSTFNNIIPSEINQKVLLWSLWRSGTHWLANILSEMIEIPWDYNSDSTNYKEETIRQLHNCHQKILVRHICMSPDELFSYTNRLGIKVILLFRDTRDVIASQVNMRKWHEGYRDGLPPFPEMEIGKILEWELENYGDFYRFNLPLWAETEHSNLIKIKYEDLSKNTVSTLKRVAEFLGLNLNQGTLKQIAQNNDFKACSKRSKGVEDKTAHNRKGIIGDFKNQFSLTEQSQLNDLFGHALARMGYV